MNICNKWSRLMALALLIAMLFNLTGCGPINEWRSNSKYDQGLELILAGKIDEASAAFTEAINLNPLNAKAFFQRGKIAYDKPDWAAAAADLAEFAKLEAEALAGADAEKAAELGAPNAEAPYLAGRAYLELDQAANALPQFDNAVKLNPQNAEAFYYRATIYLAQQDSAKASSDLDQAISLGLQDDEGHRLANAYYQRGLLHLDKAESAIADLSEAIKLDGSIVDAYYQRGLLYIQQGELDNAVADLSEVVKQDDSNVDAFFQRGKVYLKQEKLDEALADLDHVIEAQKDNNEAIFYRGMVYSLQDNASMAYTEIDRAIRAGYETAEAYYQRGMLLVGQTRSDDAIADFGKAIELDDKYVAAYYQRGKLYYADADYANAILDFDRAIFIDPSYEGVYAARALTHVDNQNFEAAVPDLDKAIEATANLTDTAGTSALYFLRGYANFQLAEMEASLADFQKTIELDPKNYAAYYNMALIYIQQGDLEKALEQIELAVKNKGGAEANHLKGDILSVLGRYEEAGKAYSASLSTGLPELGLDRSLYAALDGEIKQAISYAKTYINQNASGQWYEAAKTWVAALELEVKGEAGFELEALLNGLDESLPESYKRDASFESSLNRTYGATKYKDDPYMKYFVEAYAFTDSKLNNSVAVTVIRLADSEAQKSFDLYEITFAPIWNADEKNLEEIKLGAGDASYAFKQKKSGYMVYWASFRNGPYGIFLFYYESKADPQISFTGLAQTVVKQIDKILIDFCPFKPSLDTLKTLPALRGK